MTSCNCSQGANPSITGGGAKSKKSVEFVNIGKQTIAGVERTVYKKGNTHYLRVKKDGKFVYVKKTEFVAKSKK